ncbi:hypothetical protein QBK99_09715 [Corticibacterium sp. UT-5YL-CI-8]|nr:hypothetical protein [Tianweitania sp. UT-5YL-CI-8]
MRLLIAVFYILSSIASAYSAESREAFAARLHRHVDSVRYDPIVGQSAGRLDAKLIKVAFAVGADGKIQRVRIVSSPMSRELNAYIVRAFERLDPIKNVPASIPLSFQVSLSIGGK